MQLFVTCDSANNEIQLNPKYHIFRELYYAANLNMRYRDKIVGAIRIAVSDRTCTKHHSCPKYRNDSLCDKQSTTTPDFIHERLENVMPLKPS